jgi:regulator of replication initiation timing
MSTNGKEEDYFIPVLAPYVQWVKAYRQLISSLYDEHKTVRKAWKAFREAIPGVDRRLEFGVFEQILLFSLFLSEWNRSEEGGGPIGRGLQSKWDSSGYRGKDLGNQLDTVIQKLQSAFEERDRALWNLKHLEQGTQILREQKGLLEQEAAVLGERAETLQKELLEAREHAGRVIQELDSSRFEIAGLKQRNAALIEKGTSLEQQVERLRKKLGKLGTARIQAGRIVAVEKPENKEEYAQAVIQWVRQNDRGIIQDKDKRTSPKRVGRWNAQRSKDGYYRLYRKIGGRVHSIYIGKELDIDKAERRIADRERELLSPLPLAGATGSSHRKSQMKIEAPPRVIGSPGDGRDK